MITSESSVVRWGILGTGKVAQDFAANLAKVPGAVKQAVISKHPQNASNFSRRFGVINTYQTLPEFFQDPTIDVVYIATPTSLHHKHCLLALEHGKAVLCEKPFTLSWEEAQSVIETSRAKGLFCMEAMWLRFNPLIQKCKSLISQGTIGDICSLNLEIGYSKKLSQLGNPEQGRGAMHLFGCYGLSLAFFLFGEPQNYQCEIIKNESGVDLTVAILLRYPNHTVSITAGIKGTHSNEVHIVGSEGSIHIPSPFIDATNLHISGNTSLQTKLSQRLNNRLIRVTHPLKELFSFNSQFKGSGLRGEAEETMRCLHQGLPESPVMSLQESLLIHRLLDEIRQS